jgi:hypothetical protein
MESARAPEALRVALAGAGDADLTDADFTRAVSEADSFTTWVQAMKARFREKPAPVSTANRQAAAPARSAGA